MPKVKITQKGITHMGKELSVGSEVDVKSIPASFTNKCVLIGDDRELEVATPQVESEEKDDDRESAIELYVEKFGDKPHGRMKTETIMAAVMEGE